MQYWNCTSFWRCSATVFGKFPPKIPTCAYIAFAVFWCCLELFLLPWSLLPANGKIKGNQSCLVQWRRTEIARAVWKVKSLHRYQRSHINGRLCHMRRRIQSRVFPAPQRRLVPSRGVGVTVYRPPDRGPAAATAGVLDPHLTRQRGTWRTTKVSQRLALLSRGR